MAKVHEQGPAPYSARSRRADRRGSREARRRAIARGSEKLTGSERTYRIRIGDYRVVYELLRETKIVEIQRVRHRKDVYR